MKKYLAISFCRATGGSTCIGNSIFLSKRYCLTEEDILEYKDAFIRENDLEDMTILNIIRLEDSDDTRSTTSDSNTRE